MTDPDALPDTDDFHGVDPRAYAHRRAILATMCLSLVLIVATVSSVNVAIPHLAQSVLAPTDTQILWIVDSYALVFAALLLPAGAIGDRFGRKGALLVGLTIFALASLASAFMTNAWALIACRSVMGVGAALIMPSTLSLLQSTFPRHERAKAIAVWAGVGGAGGAIGPVMGGLLLEHFWYGSVFLVSAPLALVGLVASAALAPSSREADSPPLDLGGAAFSIAGFAALLVAIIEGPELGWSDPLVIASAAIAVVALVAFVQYERRCGEPMLDMRLFANPRFSMGSLGIAMATLSLFATFFVNTQYLQYVKGYSALLAGLGGTPFAATVMVVAPRTPPLVARLGLRRSAPLGVALVATALVMLSFATATTPYAWIAVSLVVMGSGAALTLPSLSTAILASVPMNKAGVGSAVNDTTREVGGALGIAIVGTVLSAVYRDHVTPSLAALPPQLADVANDNVGKAIAVTEQYTATDPAGAVAMRDGVRQAFLEGAHLGLRVAAALTLVGAVVMLVRLRGDDGRMMVA